MVSPFGIVVALVAAFAGAFTTNFGGIREVTQTALGPVMTILQQFGPILQTVLSMFATGDWSGGIAVLKAQIGNLGPLFTGAAGTLQTGLPAIFAILMQYIGGIATQVIGWLGAALPPIITMLGTWALAFLDWVAPMIPPMLAALGGLLAQILTSVGAALPGIVAALAGFVGAFVNWVLVVGPPLLVQLGGLIAQLLGWVALQIPPIAAQLGVWALQFLSWVGPMIPLVLVALGGLLAAFLGWIITNGPSILAQLGTWTEQFLTWVTTKALPALLTAFGTMFSGLWTELQRLWNAAFAEGSIGASMVEGIKAGIQSGWAGFVGWFHSMLLSAVPDWAKPFLGGDPAPAPPPPAKAPPNAGPPAGPPAAPPGSTTGGPPRTRYGGERAAGGGVRRGLHYLVGEQGPEIFAPGADGQISTNAIYAAITNPLASLGGLARSASGQTPRLPAGTGFAAPAAPVGGGGGVNVSISIHNPVVDTDARLAQLKQEVLTEATRQFSTAINRLTLSEG